MNATLELQPKRKRAKDERCCEPVVYPEVERHEAERMARIAYVVPGTVDELSAWLS